MCKSVSPQRVCVACANHQVRWSADKLMGEGILFGDFFDMEERATERIYRPMTDQAKLTRVLEDYYMRHSYGEKVCVTYNIAHQFMY